MQSPRVRKPLRTYSRQRKHSLHEEPPTKRRRVETTPNGGHGIQDATCVFPERDSLFTRDISTLSSRPKESPPIFSDTPSSSPQHPTHSPPISSRRSIFASMKRKSVIHSTVKEPLSETNQNTRTPPIQPRKKRQLIQMQLDLVGELRKKCKVCGMEYIPSNSEDALLHRKFHAVNIGGVDFTKAFIERIKQNQIWEGSDGSFIVVVGRKDMLALRNKASEVLKVVNTELAAVTISDDELWSQLRVPVILNTATHDKTHVPAKGNSFSTSDRFKVYLYIKGQKCVGVCLAERIRMAYAVLDQDDAAKHASRVPAPVGEFQNSSISIGTEEKPAILGISRIWTSNLHRKAGIATRLLDSARVDFLYGMTIEKERIAFSQPTGSGGELARKWFGRRAGWHVYID